MNLKNAFGPQNTTAAKDTIGQYPDLAERVVAMYQLASYTNWSGYIPVEIDQNGARNNSRYRAELVAILAEADRRTSGGAA